MSTLSAHCRRLTADSESVDKQIAHLDSMRTRGILRPDEKRNIIRFFHALHHNSRIRTPNLPVNAKKRTAKLCGVGLRTAGRLVTKWTQRKQGGTLLTADNFVTGKSNSRRNTHHHTRIPNSSYVFYQVRDFVTSNRAARANMTATEVAALTGEKISFLSTMTKMVNIRN